MHRQPALLGSALALIPALSLPALAAPPAVKPSSVPSYRIEAVTTSGMGAMAAGGAGLMRMLLFRGCAESAGAGQPEIVFLQGQAAEQKREALTAYGDTRPEGEGMDMPEGNGSSQGEQTPPKPRGFNPLQLF